MQRTSYPQITPLDDPDYPSSDGKPIADNTKQYEWIGAVQGGINDLYRDDPHVFVAGDLLWYPVEGNNKVRTAPDALVVFGRPKGDRGSYIQHREGGIAPQVVFEILSPGNRRAEMSRKLAFYDRYGPEEYYILDPDRARHKGFLRDADGKLAPIADLFGWTSPRLGIRFEMTAQMKEVLRIIRPDGRPFEFLQAVYRQRDANERRAEEQAARAAEATLRAEQERTRAERERRRTASAQIEAAQERERAEQERTRAEQERSRAEQERGDAIEARVEAAQAQARAAEATLKAERLLAQLRALGMEPDA